MGNAYDVFGFEPIDTQTQQKKSKRLIDSISINSGNTTVAMGEQDYVDYGNTAPTAKSGSLISRIEAPAGQSQQVAIHPAFGFAPAPELVQQMNDEKKKEQDAYAGIFARPDTAFNPGPMRCVDYVKKLVNDYGGAQSGFAKAGSKYEYVYQHGHDLKAGDDLSNIPDGAVVVFYGGLKNTKNPHKEAHMAVVYHKDGVPYLNENVTNYKKGTGKLSTSRTLQYRLSMSGTTGAKWILPEYNGQAAQLAQKRGNSYDQFVAQVANDFTRAYKRGAGHAQFFNAVMAQNPKLKGSEYRQLREQLWTKLNNLEADYNRRKVKRDFVPDETRNNMSRMLGGGYTTDQVVQAYWNGDGKNKGLKDMPKERRELGFATINDLKKYVDDLAGARKSNMKESQKRFVKVFGSERRTDRGGNFFNTDASRNECLKILKDPKNAGVVAAAKRCVGKDISQWSDADRKTIANFVRNTSNTKGWNWNVVLTSLGDYAQKGNLRKKPAHAEYFSLPFEVSATNQHIYLPTHTSKFRASAPKEEDKSFWGKAWDAVKTISENPVASLVVPGLNLVQNGNKVLSNTITAGGVVLHDVARLVAGAHNVLLARSNAERWLRGENTERYEALDITQMAADWAERVTGERPNILISQAAAIAGETAATAGISPALQALRGAATVVNGARALNVARYARTMSFADRVLRPLRRLPITREGRRLFRMGAGNAVRSVATNVPRLATDAAYRADVAVRLAPAIIKGELVYRKTFDVADAIADSFDVGDLTQDPKYFNSVAVNSFYKSTLGLAEKTALARGDSERLAELSAMQSQITTSNEIEDAMREGLGSSIWHNLGNRKGWNILTDLTVGSFTTMAPSLAAGTAAGNIGGLWGRAVQAVQALRGSAEAEYVSTVMDAMNKAGVDISNAGQIAAFMADPVKMGEARAEGVRRGLSVGAFDALSVALAGRLSNNSLNRTLARNFVRQADMNIFARASRSAVGQALGAGRRALTEAVFQGVLGGLGEMAGQFATGKRWNELEWADIEAEFIGELFPGGFVETGMAMATERREHAQRMSAGILTAQLNDRQMNNLNYFITINHPAYRNLLHLDRLDTEYRPQATDEAYSRVVLDSVNGLDNYTTDGERNEAYRRNLRGLIGEYNNLIRGFFNGDITQANVERATAIAQLFEGHALDPSLAVQQSAIDDAAAYMYDMITDEDNNSVNYRGNVINEAVGREGARRFRERENALRRHNERMAQIQAEAEQRTAELREQAQLENNARRNDAEDFGATGEETDAERADREREEWLNTTPEGEQVAGIAGVLQAARFRAERREAAEAERQRQEAERAEINRFRREMADLEHREVMRTVNDTDNRSLWVSSRSVMHEYTRYHNSTEQRVHWRDNGNNTRNTYRTRRERAGLLNANDEALNPYQEYEWHVANVIADNYGLNAYQVYEVITGQSDRRWLQGCERPPMGQNAITSRHTAVMRAVSAVIARVGETANFVDEVLLELQRHYGRNTRWIADERTRDMISICRDEYYTHRENEAMVDDYVERLVINLFGENYRRNLENAVRHAHPLDRLLENLTGEDLTRAGWLNPGRLFSEGVQRMVPRVLDASEMVITPTYGQQFEITRADVLAAMERIFGLSQGSLFDPNAPIPTVPTEPTGPAGPTGPVESGPAEPGPAGPTEPTGPAGPTEPKDPTNDNDPDPNTGDAIENEKTTDQPIDTFDETLENENPSGFPTSVNQKMTGEQAQQLVDLNNKETEDTRIVLSLDDINMAPEHFQFRKDGVDENGVTERNVITEKNYTPAVFGDCAVYEAGGKYYVVDGHHRIQALRKWKAENPDSYNEKINDRIRCFVVKAPNSYCAMIYGLYLNLLGENTDSHYDLSLVERGLDSEARDVICKKKETSGSDDTYLKWVEAGRLADVNADVIENLHKKLDEAALFVNKNDSRGVHSKQQFADYNRSMLNYYKLISEAMVVIVDTARENARPGSDLSDVLTPVNIDKIVAGVRARNNYGKFASNTNFTDFFEAVTRSVTTTRSGVAQAMGLLGITDSLPMTQKIGGVLWAESRDFADRIAAFIYNRTAASKGNADEVAFKTSRGKPTTFSNEAYNWFAKNLRKVKDTVGKYQWLVELERQLSADLYEGKITPNEARQQYVRGMMLVAWYADTTENKYYAAPPTSLEDFPEVQAARVAGAVKGATQVIGDIKVTTEENGKTITTTKKGVVGHTLGSGLFTNIYSNTFNGIFNKWLLDYNNSLDNKIVNILKDHNISAVSSKEAKAILVGGILKAVEARPHWGITPHFDEMAQLMYDNFDAIQDMNAEQLGNWLAENYGAWIEQSKTDEAVAAELAKAPAPTEQPQETEQAQEPEPEQESESEPAFVDNSPGLFGEMETEQTPETQETAQPGEIAEETANDMETEEKPQETANTEPDEGGLLAEAEQPEAVPEPTESQVEETAVEVDAETEPVAEPTDKEVAETEAASVDAETDADIKAAVAEAEAEKAREKAGQEKVPTQKTLEKATAFVKDTMDPSALLDKIYEGATPENLKARVADALLGHAMDHGLTNVYYGGEAAIDNLANGVINRLAEGNLKDVELDPDTWLGQSLAELNGDNNKRKSQAKDVNVKELIDSRYGKGTAASLAKSGRLQEFLKENNILQSQTQAPAITPSTSASVANEINGVFGQDATAQLTESGRLKIVSQTEADRIMSEASPDGVVENNGRVQGFVTADGTVHLVPENIQRGRAVNVLMHEVGVHTAKLGFDRSALSVITDSLSRRQNERSRTGSAIRAAMLRADQAGVQRTDANYWEEVAAYMVEDASPRIGIVRRIIAFFKELFFRAGIADGRVGEQRLVADRLTVEDLAVFAHQAVQLEANRAADMNARTRSRRERQAQAQTAGARQAEARQNSQRRANQERFGYLAGLASSDNRMLAAAGRRIAELIDTGDRQISEQEVRGILIEELTAYMGLPEKVRVPSQHSLETSFNLLRDRLMSAIGPINMGDGWFDHTAVVRRNVGQRLIQAMSEYMTVLMGANMYAFEIDNITNDEISRMAEAIRADIVRICRAEDFEPAAWTDDAIRLEGIIIASNALEHVRFDTAEMSQAGLITETANSIMQVNREYANDILRINRRHRGVTANARLDCENTRFRAGTQGGIHYAGSPAFNTERPTQATWNAHIQQAESEETLVNNGGDWDVRYAEEARRQASDNSVLVNGDTVSAPRCARINAPSDVNTLLRNGTDAEKKELMAYNRGFCQAVDSLVEGTVYRKQSRALGEAEAWYDDERDAAVANASNMFNIHAVTHEKGHALYRRVRGNLNNAARDELRSLGDGPAIRAAGGVTFSSYDPVNAERSGDEYLQGEGFAEAFRLYLTSPERLQQETPNVVAVIDEAMRPRMYLVNALRNYFRNSSYKAGSAYIGIRNERGTLNISGEELQREANNTMRRFVRGGARNGLNMILHGLNNLRWAITGAFDKYAAVRRALAEATGSQLWLNVQNPYVVLRQLAGSPAYAKMTTERFIEIICNAGVTDREMEGFREYVECERIYNRTASRDGYISRFESLDHIRARQEQIINELAAELHQDAVEVESRFRDTMRQMDVFWRNYIQTYERDFINSGFTYNTITRDYYQVRADVDTAFANLEGNIWADVAAMNMGEFTNSELWNNRWRQRWEAEYGENSRDLFERYVEGVQQYYTHANYVPLAKIIPENTVQGQRVADDFRLQLRGGDYEIADWRGEMIDRIYRGVMNHQRNYALKNFFDIFTTFGQSGLIFDIQTQDPARIQQERLDGEAPYRQGHGPYQRQFDTVRMLKGEWTDQEIQRFEQAFHHGEHWDVLNINGVRVSTLAVYNRVLNASRGLFRDGSRELLVQNDRGIINQIWLLNEHSDVFRTQVAPDMLRAENLNREVLERNFKLDPFNLRARLRDDTTRRSDLDAGVIVYRDRGQYVRAVVTDRSILTALYSVYPKERRPNRWARFGLRLATLNLRWNVTNNPAFWVNNFVGDSWTNAVLGPCGWSLSDAMRGVRESMQKQQLVNEHGRVIVNRVLPGSMLETFIQAGGSQDTSTMDENVLIADANANALRRAFNGMGRIQTRLGDLREASENANRLAIFQRVYTRLRQQGYDDATATLFAAYEARDMLDWGMRGSDYTIAGQAVNFACAFVPFARSTANGLLRLLTHTSKGGYTGVINPMAVGALTFAKMLAVVCLPKVMEALWYNKWGDDDDDEKRNRFWQMLRSDEMINAYRGETNNKDRYVLVWNAYTHKFIRLKLPFEMGFFGALAGRATNALLGNNKYWTYGLRDVAAQAFSVDELPVLDTQPILREYIKLQRNEDAFFGKPIVNKQGDYANYLHYTKGTPEWAVRFCKGLNDHLGVDWYPAYCVDVLKTFSYPGLFVDDMLETLTTSFIGDRNDKRTPSEFAPKFISDVIGNSIGNINSNPNIWSVEYNIFDHEYKELESAKGTLTRELASYFAKGDNPRKLKVTVGPARGVSYKLDDEKVMPGSPEWNEIQEAIGKISNCGNHVNLKNDKIFEAYILATEAMSQITTSSPSKRDSTLSAQYYDARNKYYENADVRGGIRGQRRTDMLAALDEMSQRKEDIRQISADTLEKLEKLQRGE